MHDLSGRLFFSHSWAYEDHYERLKELLGDRLLFIDYSIPKDDPVHTKSAEELAEAIAHKMRPCDAVIILAGVYATHSRWIKEEIKIAKRLGKKIIAVKLWGSERTSRIVKENADYIVGWNAESLVKAIKDEKYEFKLPENLAKNLPPGLEGLEEWVDESVPLENIDAAFRDTAATVREVQKASRTIATKNKLSQEAATDIFHLGLEKFVIDPHNQMVEELREEDKLFVQHYGSGADGKRAFRQAFGLISDFSGATTEEEQEVIFAMMRSMGTAEVTYKLVQALKRNAHKTGAVVPPSLDVE